MPQNRTKKITSASGLVFSSLVNHSNHSIR